MTPLPDTLIELEAAVSGAEKPHRRWFSSNEIDLIAWYENEGLARFELCYDKGISEHVLIWSSKSGFEHLAVDDGEKVEALDYKESPIYVADGHIDIKHIRDQFVGSAGNLPRDLFEFVEQKLSEFAANRPHA